MWKRRAGAALTVKDDDPAIASAGLRVVAEADVVALGAGRVGAAVLIHLVTAEAGVARLHAGELQRGRHSCYAIGVRIRVG